MNEFALGKRLKDPGSSGNIEFDPTASLLMKGGREQLALEA